MVTAGAVLFPLLSACEAPQEEKSPELQKPKEQQGVPREGDVLLVDNTYYLIRNNNHYALSPEVFRRHQRDSKLGQYGRRLITATEQDLRGFSPGRLPEEPLFIDPAIGAVKEFKPWGGEALLFLAGFVEENAVPYFDVRPKNTFAAILGKDGLEQDGWGLNHSLFFTYGVEGLEEYRAEHTARHPEENKKYAVRFMGRLKEQRVLLQYITVEHSIGGIFGDAMARAHWDVFNARVMLNVPIRGIRPTPERVAAAKALKGYLKVIHGIDEQVIDYLFGLWENKKYQKELDDFVEFFINSGRKLIVYAVENDPIVPVESAYLKGVTRILKSKKTVPPLWNLILSNPSDFPGNLMKILSVHGELLTRAEVVEEIRGLFGKNLAAAV